MTHHSNAEICEGSRRIAVPSGRFSLKFPVAWQVQAAQGENSVLIVVAQTSDGGFRANINALVHLNNCLTMDEYLTMSRLQVFQLSGSRRLAHDQPARNIRNGHVFEWSAKLGAHELTMRQLIVLHGDSIVIVTATANAAVFESHRTEFEAVLNSLEFCAEPDHIHL